MRALWLNSALVLASVVGAWLLAEALLWAVGYNDPNFYQLDGCCGAVLRPGAEGWSRREGEAFIRINSAGLRDREHALAKPPGAFRIAILGDSYAEAQQLPAEQAFWAITERELAGCPGLAGKTIEVINFGVSGYGTAQQLLTLRHRARMYRPDVVVLAFYVGNDVRNNSRTLERDPNRPYFTLQDGKLVLDDSFRENDTFKFHHSSLGRITRGAIYRSRVLQLLNESRRALSNRVEAREAAKRDENRAEGQEVGLDTPVFSPPKKQEWAQAWLVTEALLEEFAKESAGIGAKPLVASISTAIQVHYDPKARERFMVQLGISDLFYPDRRVTDHAGRHGIASLMLGPLLQAEAERRGVCLHGFSNSGMCRSHWNADGHLFAGRLIAQKVCAELAH